MDLVSKKSSDKARGLLFGLPVRCTFSSKAQTSCPLRDIRNNLSIEEKYKYVLGLNDEEVISILAQHDNCFYIRQGHFDPALYLFNKSEKTFTLL